MVGELIGENACRPKYWKELTDSEKIERMRGELKTTQRRLANAVSLADGLLRIVYEHHHVNEKIMIPAISRYGQDEKCATGKPINPDEAYF